MNRRSHRLFAIALLAAIAFAAFADNSDPAKLNAPFRDPELNSEVWVERFEREGRDAWDYREQIADALALSSGDAVADVGAGTGLFEPLLAARVGSQGKVYAVDIAPRFIEHIRAKAAEHGLAQVEAILGANRSTNLPAGSVDLVFVCDTYHHFEDHAAMLASIHAALRPGGRLVIVDFDRIEGISPKFILEHIRADKAQFTREIEAGGFRMLREIAIAGMTQSFVREFERIDAGQ